jgi:hypothetical protein
MNLATEKIKSTRNDCRVTDIMANLLKCPLFDQVHFLLAEGVILMRGRGTPGQLGWLGGRGTTGNHHVDRLQLPGVPRLQELYTST